MHPVCNLAFFARMLIYFVKYCVGFFISVVVNYFVGKQRSVKTNTKQNAGDSTIILCTQILILFIS